MSELEGKFSSIEEERDYYKELAMKYKIKYEETNLELEEFQESSREFERELETQLEQEEARNKELNSAVSRLSMDYEVLQEKFQKNQIDSRKQVSDLEDELSRVKAQRDDLQKYIRELEQLNDDLERAKRATVSSLEDFEARLNQAIERNAFLESELDEKEALKVMVQRLKDESRDLRQEMTVHQTNKPVFDGSLTSEKSEKVERILTNGIDSKKIDSELQETSLSPLKSPISSIAQMNTATLPFTPSSRITALNIVADLLRKVGALESKLASCRIYVKETSPKAEKEDNVLGSPVLAKRLSKSSLSSPTDSISLTA